MVRGSYTQPIQTTASSSESSSLAASNNNNQQTQHHEAQQQHQMQRRQEQSTHHAARRQTSAPGLHSALSNREIGRDIAAPVALVPRMNELLQQVPPNVSIPDCPDLDSIVMLQQRRRISSGGSPVSGISFTNVKGSESTSGIQLSQRQQMSALSASSAVSSIPSPTKTEAPSHKQQPQLFSGGRLLMQQLNAGSIYNGQTRPQHFGVWAQNDESYRMLSRRPRYASDQQHAISEQFQAPLNQQREVLMPGHLEQHQQQRTQGIINRSSHVQLSVQEQPITSRDQFGGADGDRGRSLLQQLLSD